MQRTMESCPRGWLFFCLRAAHFWVWEGGRFDLRSGFIFAPKTLWAKNKKWSNTPQNEKYSLVG